MKSNILLTLAVSVATVSMAVAQDVIPVENPVIIERHVEFAYPAMTPIPPIEPLEDNTFIFMGSEFGAGIESIKGVPFTAEAVTERTQVLSDGNKLFNKSSAMLYRDSEGRTRREKEFNRIGPWAEANEGSSKHIFIHDPVAKEHYILKPQEKSAHKLSLFDHDKPHMFRERIIKRMNPSGSIPAPPTSPTPPTTPAPPMPPTPPTPPTPEMVPEGTPMHYEEDVIIRRRHGNVDDAERDMKFTRKFPEGKSESLGKKVIEGISAEGTRTKTVIETGKIGNVRPIEIISEKWYSPELQMNILTKHSDPRFGETVYRLTKIRRTEPEPSLFKIPSDYKITKDPLLPPPPRKPE